MQITAFAIYDDKAEAYTLPFYFHHIPQATREFINCCRDERHAYHSNPHDYHLYVVGVYDDNEGTFEPELTHIMDGKSVPKIEESV